MDIQSELVRLYTDPKSKAAFSSAGRLFAHAKLIIPNISLKQIKSFLKTQPSYTLHKPVRRHFKRGQVIVDGLYSQSDLDLADMGSLAADNNKMGFIIVLVDIFSRFASVQPIERKTATSVYDGMIKIFESLKDSGRSLPKKIRHDAGREFENKDFRRLMKEYNVSNFSTTNYPKANYAERFIRTLKEKIHRYLTANNTDRYIDVLQDLVASFNESIHGSINMKPIDVNENNEKDLFQNLYQKPNLSGKPQPFTFELGSQVRIPVKKGALSKGYTAGWTETVYLIRGRFRRNGIPIYKVEDLTGRNLPNTFYAQELQSVDVSTDKKILRVLHTRINKRKKEYFVIWRNMGNGHNSWITQEEYDQYK